MKKSVCLVLAVLVMLFVSTIPGYAVDGGAHSGGDGHPGSGGHPGGGGHHGGDGHHGGSWDGSFWIGPGWGPWWWGAPYYPSYPSYPSYPYYPYDPYYSQPRTYVQPAPQPEEQYYWYFCQDPQGYYPYVKKCPKGWLKVIPSAPQDEEE